ncbi:phage tail tip lysozyme, partial [Mesorhizobium sp.]
MGSAPDLSKNDVYSGFMDTVKTKVTNPNALAAIAATGNAESSFSPNRAFGSWSDPSESGQAGTAGGILSWRGPRFEAMRAFAGSNGGDANAPSPQLQAQYFLQEDPGLIDALNAAKSPEEAQRLMNNAWKFAGYNRPGGEAARRISMANSFASRFAGSEAAPVQAASLEPGAGVSAALSKRPLPQEYASKGITQDQWDRMNAPDGPAAVVQPVQSPRATAPAAVQTSQAAPVQVAGGPSVQQLLQASQDPRLSEQQRGVVNLMLKQKLDEANPSNQLELEKNRLEVEKLRNPQMTPAEKARL